nr:immunoglobulin heavy chain junction region [Mus musculus]
CARRENYDYAWFAYW